MKFIITIKKAVIEHLYIKAPEQSDSQIKQVQLNANLHRFLLLCIASVLANVFLITIYSNNLYIIIMGLLVVLINRLIVFPPEYDSFLGSNIIIVFPFAFFALETLLFHTGAQGFEQLFRFLAVPFIISSIVIISQKQMLLVQLLIYVTTYLYLVNFTQYTKISSIAFFISFICSNLISNLLYSSFVNSNTLSINYYKLYSELQQLHKTIEFDSKKDHLTKLSNRREFAILMGNYWEQMKAQRGGVAIMMLDIDGFKQYNDYYGHTAGDSCLVKVANEIQSKIKLKSYILARYGGEEFIFVTIINDEENEKHIIALAESIRKSVEKLQIESINNNASPFVTLSIGIAICTVEEDLKSETAIGWANDCLFYAKSTGKNRIVYTKDKSSEFYNIKDERLYDKEAYTQNSFSKTVYSSDQMNRVILEANADSVFVYYKQQDIIEFSETAIEIYSLPYNIYKPRLENMISFIIEDYRASFISDFRKHIANLDKVFSIEVPCLLRNQNKTWLSIRVKCIYNHSGGLEVAVGSIVNLDNMLEYNRFVEQQTMTHSLTHLPNRRKFNDDVQELLSKPDAFGYIVALDIRRFKLINTLYSHAIGDKALAEIAKILLNITSLHGNLYSYATDQFMLLCKSSSQVDIQDAMQIINQYFQLKNVVLESIEIKIQFYLGALEYKTCTTTLEQLMVDIDITIQRSKYPNKNGYIFFNEQDRTNYFQSTTLETKLKEDVENGCKQFVLYYQPIIDAKTLLCVGAEALLRWTEEDKIIPPVQVIPILEQAGVMDKLEAWIFDTASQKCGEWISMGMSEDFFIHVNLSATQITRSSLISEVTGSLKKYGIKPHNIIVEVTESSVMHELNASIKALELLRENGLKIAIDDFGTGYSSLSYLRSLPIDEIKIDRSFVENIETDPSAAKFVSSIIEMSKSLGYMVCVEGVETRAQQEMLSGFKVNVLQGFLFRKPIPAEDFISEYLHI